ncbi:unnamed protein product [Polarella glacialis]|uniref:Uncharacterized protein n=1 Tax=Polarella glacialis TaxID=89957 RepID=A0A813JR51_POLGL|nr:unnamed protein product [Polarella glacialis]
MGGACGAQRGRPERQLFHAARHNEVGPAKAALKTTSTLNAKDLLSLQTALHIAAHEGSIGVATLLLDLKALVSGQDDSGDTPLHLALYAGQPDQLRVAQLLLSRRAAADSRGAADKTALHLAARRGQIEAVQLLATSGAAISFGLVDKDGDAPLHEAAREGQLAVAQELLRSRAPIDTPNTAGRSALAVAAVWGHEAALLREGASIQSVDACGDTPLHQAARAGRQSIAERLAQARAPLDARNKDQRTPLHVCCVAGHAAAVASLLQLGASPEAPDAKGDTPVHLAARAGQTAVLEMVQRLRVMQLTQNAVGRTAVHEAARNGRGPALATLLRGGLKADTPDTNGDTPLHCAVLLTDGHQVVVTLLSAGAPVEARRRDGMAALVLAASEGRPRTVELLLRAAANPESYDLAGDTALHYAAGAGHLAVVELMLERRASPNARNSRGETPFQVAGTKGHIAVARAMNQWVSFEQAQPAPVQFTPSAMQMAQTLPVVSQAPVQTLPAGYAPAAQAPGSPATPRARTLPPPNRGREPLTALLRRGQGFSPASMRGSPLGSRTDRDALMSLLDGSALGRTPLPQRPGLPLSERAPAAAPAVPPRPVALTEPRHLATPYAPSTLGETAPLNGQGLAAALRNNSAQDAEAFVRRVVAALGYRVLEQRGITSLASKVLSVVSQQQGDVAQAERTYSELEGLIKEESSQPGAWLVPGGASLGLPSTAPKAFQPLSSVARPWEAAPPMPQQPPAWQQQPTPTVPYSPPAPAPPVAARMPAAPAAPAAPAGPGLAPPPPPSPSSKAPPPPPTVVTQPAQPSSAPRAFGALAAPKAPGALAAPKAPGALAAPSVLGSRTPPPPGGLAQTMPAPPPPPSPSPPPPSPHAAFAKTAPLAVAPPPPPGGAPLRPGAPPPARPSPSPPGALAKTTPPSSPAPPPPPGASLGAKTTSPSPPPSRSNMGFGTSAGAKPATPPAPPPSAASRTGT